MDILNYRKIQSKEENSSMDIPESLIEISEKLANLI